MARYLVNQLQLPYLRLVLADSRFFSEQGHPGQKVLAEIVHLSHSSEVPESPQALKNNRFYTLLIQLVGDCIEAERIYDFDFHRQLAEMIAIREAQRQQLKVRSQLFEDSEAGVAQTQVARDAVDQLLESRLMQFDLAEDIDISVLEDVSHVLYKAALMEGVNSIVWKSSVMLLDRLIKSLMPASQVKSRRSFIRQIGKLLPDLREAFEGIGVESAALLQFFKVLESNHTKIIVAVDPTTMDENDELYDEAMAETLSAADLSMVSTHAAAAIQSVAQLAVGTWVNWQRTDSLRRCQVVAYIRHADKYIFTSRSGDKVGELSGAELAHMLDTGDVVILKSGPAFRSALETVIGDIREQGH